MSKVTDILTSEGFASADDARKAQLTKAVTDLEVILKDSGFSVLLNKSEGTKQEFVPGTRITEVTAQKHNLTGEVENLNKQLKKLKKAAEVNDDPETAGKIQTLIEANAKLKTTNTEQDTNYQIRLAAMELGPHNLDDLAAKFNRDVIQNVNGTMIGLDAEKARIKAEKGYMLKGEKDDDHSNETFDKDKNKQDENATKANFNDMIRSAAGRGRA